jgi:hypothetical protein
LILHWLAVLDGAVREGYAVRFQGRISVAISICHARSVGVLFRYPQRMRCIMTIQNAAAQSLTVLDHLMRA